MDGQKVNRANKLGNRLGGLTVSFEPHNAGLVHDLPVEAEAKVRAYQRASKADSKDIADFVRHAGMR